MVAVGSTHYASNMDNVVFAVDAHGGSGAEAAIAGSIPEHPGDTAPPRVILQWLDAVDSSIGGTAFGVILYDDVPASLKRSTAPVDVEDYPVLTLNHVAGITAAMVTARDADRKRILSENAR